MRLRGAALTLLLLFALTCLFPQFALAARPPSRDVSVRNTTFYRQTPLSIKSGRKRVPLYCVYPKGERFGVPAIAKSLDRRRSRFTFTKLNSRQQPKLSPIHTAMCAQTERACAPQLRVTSQSLSVLESTSTAVTLSLRSPTGCSVGTSAHLISTPSLGTASLSGVKNLNIQYNSRPGSIGTDILNVLALNSLGQQVVLSLPITVQARACAPSLVLSDSSIASLENDITTISYSIQQPPLCAAPTVLNVSTAPQHGSVEISAGQVVYRPHSHYVGADGFTLSAQNDRGETHSVPMNISLAQRQCLPRLEVAEQSVTTIENQPVNVAYRLITPAGCELPVSTSILSSPTHGTATVDAGDITYNPDLHFVGTDTLSVRVANSRGEASDLPLNMTILRGAAEFAGDEASLGDYRNTLTSNEVRHLLCKYALCGNSELYQIGITQGRSSLVNALLQYDTSPATVAIRQGIASQLGSSTDEFAYQIGENTADSSSCSSTGRLWGPRAVQNYWLAQLRYDNPLREHLSIHLHHHLPINVWVNFNGGTGFGCSSHNTYKSHVDMLRVHALGRAPQTTDEIPVTGSFKGLITDVLTDYQMGLYLSHIQPWLTPGPQGWNDWKVGVHTNNFARELMQIFTLGPIYALSPPTSPPIPNYTEHDVEEVARALAGHINPITSHLSQVPSLKRTPWRLAPNDMGRYLEWSAAYREVGTKTIFENATEAGVRKQGDLRPADVIDSIFNHRGIVYAPLSFFSRSVYPAPSRATIQELGNHFSSTNFSIPSLYNLLMNSSASFSRRARYGCISSGPVHVLRLLNTLQLRLTSLTAPGTSSHAGFGEMLDIMRQMGDALLETPSIFGYGECGDIDGTPGELNFGQAMLAPQRMLGRFNAPFRIMKFYLEGNYPWTYPVTQEGFAISSLFPPGVTHPTPEQMISHFELLFGITLSDAERTIVMNYLDPTDSSRGRWDSSNQRRTQFRVANLVAIFANHPDVNVR